MIEPTKKGFIAFPFYIFITIIINSIGVITLFQQLDAQVPLGQSFLLIALTITHIILYWLNVRQFEQAGWGWYYLAGQIVLITLIALLPKGTEIMLPTLMIALVGETIGIHGNTRRTLWTGLGILGYILLFSYFRLPAEDFPQMVSALTVNGGFIALVLVLFNQQMLERQKAEALAKNLENAYAQLAHYAARNEELTLKAERERLARELHDTLAQGVAGLIMQLEAVKAHQAQANTEQASAVLERAITRARGTLQDSRAAIEDLRNRVGDFQGSVQNMVQDFSQNTKMPVTLDYQLPADLSIPAHIQHHARRALNEALTNIAKHASARQAWVVFRQSPGGLHLVVRDDGVGFEPNAVPKQGHYGLQGLEERTRLTHGHYSLESKPGAGTKIDLLFPLTEEEA